MPGFIDAHTHMDMPFGGTITADDWDSGTAAAVAGGTTVLVDFALQDIGAGLVRRHRHVAGQGDGADPDRLRPARRRLRPERRREGRDPRADEHGVCTVKVFMAYKGTPLFTPDEGLFEIMQIARDSGVHGDGARRERRRRGQAPGAGARARRTWTRSGTPSPAPRRSRPRRPAARSASPRSPTRPGRRPRDLRARRRRDPPRPRPRPGRARRDVPPVPGDHDRRPEQARVRGREVRLLPAAARRLQPRPSSGARWRPASWCSSARTTARSTSRARRSSGRATSRRSRTACPGSRSARRCSGPTACAAGASRRDLRGRARPPTRRGCTGCCRARASSPPAPTRTSWCGTPSCRSPSTHANRHDATTTRPTRARSSVGAPERGVRARDARLRRRRRRGRARVRRVPAASLRSPRRRRPPREPRSTRRSRSGGCSDLAGRPATPTARSGSPGATPARRRATGCGSELAEITGVEVDTDPAGNIWAALPGDERAERRVVGGHTDSVPDGGWLDGVLNVVAALSVMRAVAAGPRPPLTLRLVDWADEEGARFGRSPRRLERRRRDPRSRPVRGLRDRDGVALPDALAARGVELDRMLEAGAELDGAAAYLELHIEQGPVLESIDRPLGVVSGVFGLQRHRVVFRGAHAHAGATPMHLRRDAFLTAARAALAAREGAERAGGHARHHRRPSRWRRGSSPRSTGPARFSLDQRAFDAGVARRRWSTRRARRPSASPPRRAATVEWTRSSRRSRSVRRRSWSRSPPRRSRTRGRRRRPACRAARCTTPPRWRA